MRHVPRLNNWRGKYSRSSAEKVKAASRLWQNVIVISCAWRHKSFNLNLIACDRGRLGTKNIKKSSYNGSFVLSKLCCYLHKHYRFFMTFLYNYDTFILKIRHVSNDLQSVIVTFSNKTLGIIPGKFYIPRQECFRPSSQQTFQGSGLKKNEEKKRHPH